MRSAIVRNKFVVFKDHKTPSNYPELMTLSVTRSDEIETQKLYVTIDLHHKVRFVYID